MSEIYAQTGSLIVGLVVGAVFAFFRVPIPAPPTFTGVLGIFGIYAGFQLLTKVL